MPVQKQMVQQLWLPKSCKGWQRLEHSNVPRPSKSLFLFHPLQLEILVQHRTYDSPVAFFSLMLFLSRFNSSFDSHLAPDTSTNLDCCSTITLSVSRECMLSLTFLITYTVFVGQWVKVSKQYFSEKSYFFLWQSWQVIEWWELLLLLLLLLGGTTLKSWPWTSRSTFVVCSLRLMSHP